ncbi:MAG: phosphodiesterase [Pirellulaceae bacterium]
MPLRVIQITDCHLFADAATQLKGICTRERLGRVLQALQAELPRAERLIVTGDLAHDDKRETYEAFRELLADWLPRVRLLPGNHDDRTLMRQIFGDVVQAAGERNVFAESVGNWLLVGLDTQITDSLSGELGGEQLAWLEEQLTASSLPTALFLHHPPVPVNSLWLEKIGLKDASDLWQLLARFPQVRVICTGHVHQESATSHGSMLVLTTPSTAVQFRPESDVLVVDDVLPGYRILELADDGSVQTRVMRVSVA